MSKKQNFTEKYAKEINAAGHAIQVLQQHRQQRSLEEQNRLQRLGIEANIKIESEKLRIELEKQNKEEERWQAKKAFVEALSDINILIQSLAKIKSDNLEYKHAVYKVKKSLNEIEQYRNDITDINALNQFKEIQYTINNDINVGENYEEIIYKFVNYLNVGVSAAHRYNLLDVINNNKIQKPYNINQIRILLKNIKEIKDDWSEIKNYLKKVMLGLNTLVDQYPSLLDKWQLTESDFNYYNENFFIKNLKLNNINNLLILYNYCIIGNNSINHLLSGMDDELTSILNKYNSLTALDKKINNMVFDNKTLEFTENDCDLLKREKEFKEDIVNKSHLFLSKLDYNELNELVSIYAEFVIHLKIIFPNKSGLVPTDINNFRNLDSEALSILRILIEENEYIFLNKIKNIHLKKFNSINLNEIIDQIEKYKNSLNKEYIDVLLKEIENTQRNYQIIILSISNYKNNVAYKIFSNKIAFRTLLSTSLIILFLTIIQMHNGYGLFIFVLQMISFISIYIIVLQKTNVSNSDIVKFEKYTKNN